MDLARRLVPAVVLVALLAGGLVLAAGGPGSLVERVDQPGKTEGLLTVRWVSDTGTSIQGNHHAVAAGRVDGEAVVLVPLGGRGGEDHAHPEGGPAHTHTGSGGECALVALDGAGEERWRSTVSEANCTIHAVADPALADFLGDDRPEALSTSTDDEVSARDPLTGEVLFEASLDEYGYTRPVVADLDGSGERELLVVDVRGTVSVFRPDGSTVWTRSFDAYAWGQPVVADFTGDGRSEIVAGFDDGQVVLLDGATGATVWNRSAGVSVTWLATGESDAGLAVYAATTDGQVVALDAATGERTWTRSFDALAAIGAFGDGDGDGEQELYVTARDARLRALDAATGETTWTTTLTDGEVQMTPPPSLGDVDGDGEPEVVAPTNDGLVRVLDPTDGSMVATYRRPVAIYTYATLADLDGDGASEILVPYGDGRVVALSLASG